MSLSVVSGGHNGKKVEKTEPLLNFAVLLRNGQVLDQRATTWLEVTDDEGVGASYQFYVGKVRVMSIEYTEVRAVFCREHCDVDKAIRALRRKRGTANGTGK